MMVKINGQSTEIAEEATLQTLVELKKISPKTIILELNGQIVNSEKWPNTLLKTGDKLEIIRIIGGG
jgi:sulfur carrier protein